MSEERIVQENDILIIEDRHRVKARYIFDHTPSIADVICIGGGPGSGKSETAHVLTALYQQCDIEAYPVKLDNLYIIDHIRRAEWRRTTGYVGKDEIDWCMVKAKVNQIVNQWHAIAILDGIYACYFNYPGRFKIYLDGTCEQTYEFRKARGKEDPDDEFRLTVIKRECKSAHFSKRYADLIVPF